MNYDLEKEQLFAIWALGNSGQGTTALYEMVKKFKFSEAIYKADLADYPEKVKKRGYAGFQKKDLGAAKNILEYCRREKIDVIPYSSSRFPPEFRMLEKPPAALFVVGKLPQNNFPALAIVGTRGATENGKRFAAGVAYDLARSGFLIVSGLAKGIDTYAHKGALMAEKTTVAFVAGGVNKVYPKENEALYQHIIESGAVASEFLPDTPINAYMFHSRNRLISAFSQGVLVVESAIDGGSMITVNHAIDQQRKLYAVPGFPYSEKSEGCNALIKKGTMPVTTARDILDDYNKRFGVNLILELRPIEKELKQTEEAEKRKEILERASKKKEQKNVVKSSETKAAPPNKTDEISGNLSENAKLIYMIIKAEGSVSIDRICERLEIQLANALSVLGEMELDGILTELGGFYSIK